MPEIEVGGQILEVVDEYKLVGVMISSNLKWDENTDYITKKAYSRLWMLRRLKNLGLKKTSLLQVFTMQIRSVLEFGAVVWHSMLTDQNSRAIERVQKSALSVILGPSYLCYENALSQTGLKRLDEDEGDEVIPDNCHFWYATIFFRPVKGTPKNCVNSRQKLPPDKTA